MNPKQPLTVGIWFGKDYATPREIVDLADTITIHSFDNVDTLEAQLLLAETFGRPVIATEWLQRSAGSTFEKVLPILSAHKVGWYHWGLVKGRSQLFIPRRSRPGDPESDLWEHDLLYEDGKPFDPEELDLIRGFQFKN